MTTLSAADGERLRQAFEKSRDMEGSLKQRLEAYAAAGRKIFPAYSHAVDQLVIRIQENGGGKGSPQVGAQMPPFVLPDENGQLMSLEALLKDGPVAVMFHRGHWCPYCRLNIHALIQAESRIKSTGSRVIVIMPELQKLAKQFKIDSGAPFPILNDMDNGYALSLNLAIWLGDEIRRLLSHQDLAAFHGNDGWVLPIPGTFVVGRDGFVKARFVDPEYRNRMEIDDLIAAMETAD
jgi:peroxiredoxin